MENKTQKRLEFIINFGYAGIITGIIFVLYKYGISLLMPFILAMGLVAMIQPIIRFIHKKFNIKQNALSVVVLILVYVFVGWLIVWGISIIAKVSIDLFTGMPDYFQTTVLPVLTEFINWLDRYIQMPELNQFIENLNSSLLTWVQDIAVRFSQKGLQIATSLTKNVASYFITFLFMVMFSFSINLRYDEVMSFIDAQLPDNVKSVLSNTRRIFKDVFGKYIKSFVILMIITFIELCIGFLIIGTDNFIPIALGISLLDALPIFGTGTVIIPWIIIELVQQNFSYAIGLIVIYAVITIVRRILEPKVVGKQLGMNPVVSLLSIYMGYRLLGVFGMIFAPIIVQIITELHNDGTITLYRKPKNKEAQPTIDA